MRYFQILSTAFLLLASSTISAQIPDEFYYDNIEIRQDGSLKMQLWESDTNFVTVHGREKLGDFKLFINGKEQENAVSYPEDTTKMTSTVIAIENRNAPGPILRIMIRSTFSYWFTHSDENYNEASVIMTSPLTVMNEFSQDYDQIDTIIGQQLTNIGFGSNSNTEDILFNPDNGLIAQAKKGKFNRHIIYYFFSYSEFDLERAIKECKENDITFHALRMDFEMPKQLKELCQQTGGMYQERFNGIDGNFSTLPMRRMPSITSSNPSVIIDVPAFDRYDADLDIELIREKTGDTLFTYKDIRDMHISPVADIVKLGADSETAFGQTSSLSLDIIASGGEIEVDSITVDGGYVSVDIENSTITDTPGNLILNYTNDLTEYEGMITVHYNGGYSIDIPYQYGEDDLAQVHNLTSEKDIYLNLEQIIVEWEKGSSNKSVIQYRRKGESEWVDAGETDGTRFEMPLEQKQTISGEYEFRILDIGENIGIAKSIPTSFGSGQVFFDWWDDRSVFQKLGNGSQHGRFIEDGITVPLFNANVSDIGNEFFLDRNDRVTFNLVNIVDNLTISLASASDVNQMFSLSVGDRYKDGLVTAELDQINNYANIVTAHGFYMKSDYYNPMYYVSNLASSPRLYFDTYNSNTLIRNIGIDNEGNIYYGGYSPEESEYYVYRKNEDDVEMIFSTIGYPAYVQFDVAFDKIIALEESGRLSVYDIASNTMQSDIIDINPIELKTNNAGLVSIMSNDTDGTVLIYDINNGTIQYIDTEIDSPKHHAWSPNGERLLVNDFDNQKYIYELKDTVESNILTLNIEEGLRTPSMISFPNSYIGQTSESGFAIRNISGQPITLDSITFSGQEPQMFTLDQEINGMILEAEAIESLYAVFTPADTGNIQRVMSIHYNGGFTATTALSGRVSTKDLIFSKPENYLHGELFTQRDDFKFELINMSGADIQIDTILMESLRPEFELADLNLIERPSAIAGGQRGEIIYGSNLDDQRAPESTISVVYNNGADTTSAMFWLLVENIPFTFEKSEYPLNEEAEYVILTDNRIKDSLKARSKDIAFELGMMFLESISLEENTDSDVTFSYGANNYIIEGYISDNDGELFRFTTTATGEKAGEAQILYGYGKLKSDNSDQIYYFSNFNQTLKFGGNLSVEIWENYLFEGSYIVESIEGFITSRSITDYGIYDLMGRKTVDTESNSVYFLVSEDSIYKLMVDRK